MTPDATLNTHSEGADDAGMERIFCTSNQTLGNHVQFTFRHINNQRRKFNEVQAMTMRVYKVLLLICINN